MTWNPQKTPTHRNFATRTCTGFPKFSVNFIAPTAEWQVTLGSKYLRVVRAFQIGDTLEINCSTGAVLINTGNALSDLDWQNSEFIALQPGSNTLTMAPHGVCTATVSFIPRWL
ncbi:phage distal tail protein [Desulfofarcimen acetoxidans]|uniref:phage distal tail protein n=1 Tax=Desulfofarcimen acetoxidans TaxID=58138 RepID=UPI000A048C24